MSKTELVEIGFLSGVSLAKCKCHAGQWAITVFMVQPGQPDIAISQKHFETKKQADDAVDLFTKQTAEDQLKKMGLSIETETDVMTGEKALKELNHFKKNSNPNLH